MRGLDGSTTKQVLTVTVTVVVAAAAVFIVNLSVTGANIRGRQTPTLSGKRYILRRSCRTAI